MALTITTRQYVSGNAGTTALADDLKNMFDWSEIDESTDGVVIFKKYNDAEGGQYVALRLTATGSNPGRLGVLSKDGAVTHETEVNTGNGAELYNVNFVQWEGGFHAHGCRSAMPNSNTAYHTSFGVGFGTNQVRQAAKWCAWLGCDCTWHIASPGTTSVECTSLPVRYGGLFAVAHPLAVANCEYAPDRLLYLRQVPAPTVNTCGWCTWNGKRYYKNGGILIPEEV